MTQQDLGIAVYVALGVLMLVIIVKGVIQDIRDNQPIDPVDFDS